ncbi:MAG: hypothetical protein P4M05_05380, partial [Bradyrhizobium sp.]|nr:hypothetical protein [Bradyrhizobium sp.]
MSVLQANSYLALCGVGFTLTFNEYYDEVLPGLVWRNLRAVEDTITLFGRGDYLKNQVASYGLANIIYNECSLYRYWPCLPGQAGGFFGFDEYSIYFMKFL